MSFDIPEDLTPEIVDDQSFTTFRANLRRDICPGNITFFFRFGFTEIRIPLTS
jgi:hypothetical protein